MNLKNLFILTLACAGIAFASCSKEKEEPIVGIVSGSITPFGSSVAYKLEPKGAGVLENTNDSVAWDVTDAALSEATVKLDPTLDATVLYNNQPVGPQGVVVNTTSNISFTVKGSSGKTMAYTLNVVRAKSSEIGFTKKASSFNGLPSKFVWMDVTAFKGKFYALVISTKSTASKSPDTTEELYQLFNSVDGLAWSEVPYTVTGANDVIGGEGARLVTFKDKLYVLGGMRTLGKDKFGNPAELENGWFGPSPVIKQWRSYVSTDGTNFQALLSKTKIKKNGEEINPENMYVYNNPYATLTTFGDKLYVHGGYTIGFGMIQGANNTLSTSDGMNWEVLTTTVVDEAKLTIPTIGTNLFVFKNKLYMVGGFSSYIDPKNMKNGVFSSTDGTTWKLEAETVEGFKNLYQSKVVVNNNIIYLFGGETLGADGETRLLSNFVYRSTDAIHWTPISVPKSFIGTRYVSSAIMGQAVWFFGGYNSLSSGHYAAPTVNDIYGSDTWNAILK
nr:hypothetical protein [uncultured Prevotella sp.]